jgi:micrococcal nuclease
MPFHKASFPKSYGWCLAGAAAFLAFATPPLHAACVGADGGTSAVTEISEGETLILGDGRTVRLANVVIPKRTRNAFGSEDRAELEKLLTELLRSKKVELKLDDQKRDRYGRLFAQVVAIGDNNERIWVQERLVSAGLVRVVAVGTAHECVRDLLARENEAREGKRGLWKTGHLAVRPASESLLAGLLNSYEIVEGEVQNVAEIRGNTYVNFGRDWRRDFTIVVPEKVAKDFTQNGTKLALAELKGKSVRVRGWIKDYNGPSITIDQPEQMEVLANDLPQNVSSTNAAAGKNATGK